MTSGRGNRSETGPQTCFRLSVALLHGGQSKHRLPSFLLAKAGSAVPGLSPSPSPCRVLVDAPIYHIDETAFVRFTSLQTLSVSRPGVRRCVSVCGARAGLTRLVGIRVVTWPTQVVFVSIAALAGPPHPSAAWRPCTCAEGCRAARSCPSATGPLCAPPLRPHSTSLHSGMLRVFAGSSFPYRTRPLLICRFSSTLSCLHAAPNDRPLALLCAGPCRPLPWTAT